MEQHNLVISVFLVPGGEGDSARAYRDILALIEAHQDLDLAVYHGQNSYDGKWSLVLIGERNSFVHYGDPIRHSLEAVDARRIQVPPESLTPLVEKFIARRVEMAMRGETFFAKHYPRGNDQPARRKNRPSPMSTRPRNARKKKKRPR